MATRISLAQRFRNHETKLHDDHKVLVEVAEILKKEYKKAERRLEKNRAQQKIITALGSSWKDQDPGKYSDAYFLLDRNGKRAVAKELLPPEIEICGSQEQWSDYLRELRFQHRYEMVPPFYSVINLKQAKKQRCPRCGKLALLVEHYVQTCDSDVYDEWLKELIIICTHCGQMDTVKKQSKDARF